MFKPYLEISTKTASLGMNSLIDLKKIKINNQVQKIVEMEGDLKLLSIIPVYL